MSLTVRCQNLIGSYGWTHNTFILIGSCNKHPNIQRCKATKIHTHTPLTYKLFFQNTSIMGNLRNTNGQFWNWLVHKEVFTVFKSLVCLFLVLVHQENFIPKAFVFAPVKCRINYCAKKSTMHKLWQIMKYLNWPDDNIMTKLWPRNPIKSVSNGFKAFSGTLDSWQLPCEFY